MGRGNTIYLSYTALVLLSASPFAGAEDLWKVSIWEGPAPSPADGPPFSAHASRNPALLPYQIIGIVGAYVGSVLIVGSLLLTIGRNARKKAQTMALQPREMVKPMPRAFEPSPISPQGSWYSPRRLRGKKSATSSIRSGGSQQMSPGMHSVVSFDNTVLEADRARGLEEMERLYAAVMAQDASRNSQQNVAPTEINNAPPEYSRKNPPRVVTDAPALRHLQPPGAYSGPTSPTTPKSPVRAIYPPGSSVPPGPTSPTSPLKAEYTNYSLPQSTSDLRVDRHTRTSSFGSARTATTNTQQAGAPSKLKKSLRNLKISAPLSTTRSDDNSDGARTPLSPRTYTNPGVPPEPPTSRTTESTDSAGYAVPTPRTPKSWRPDDQDGEQMDEVRNLPQPNPQRGYVYDSPAQMVTNAASTRPDPTKPAPITTSTNTLPFREMNRQYASQQQTHAHVQAAFPLSPSHWNHPNQQPQSAGGGYVTSAGPVKTTFLESRRDRLQAGTPRTGMATPYSPYMPYTPLTPVTPRLTTRAERKQREKEDRQMRGAIAEEDQVADEKELWSSGY